MTVHEVATARDRRDFLALPDKIYKDDPYWVKPLDKDIEKVFDPKRNKFFKQGICKRWLLKNDRGEVIGRVAAFVNRKYDQEQPTGGIGFFEVVKSKEAAFHLLDHCKQWLAKQGMEAMDGPINFGERDRWWGLLTDGFYEPLYGMNYNPPYYVDFFEEYGFQVYFEQLCYGMKVALDFEEKFYTAHTKHKANSDLKVDNIKRKNIAKYARDFVYIYNKAWAQHGEGGKEMKPKTAVKLFKTMRPVLDENICWLVYEKKEPIACWINLPDLNFYFKKLNGKFGLWQKLKFLWMKKTQPCPRFTGIVFGVIPKWQKAGIDYYMIVESAQRFVPTTSYMQYEMQWIGDFNPKMIKIAENLGAHVTRKLATYRYLFDRNKSFSRHPKI